MIAYRLRVEEFCVYYDVDERRSEALLRHDAPRRLLTGRGTFWPVGVRSRRTRRPELVKVRSTPAAMDQP
jgi:hypothetical protein